MFLNGLAIMAFELKCNAAGQNYENAILQYRTERNPKTPALQIQSRRPGVFRDGLRRSVYDNQA